MMGIHDYDLAIKRRIPIPRTQIHLLRTERIRDRILLRHGSIHTILPIQKTKEKEISWCFIKIIDCIMRGK